MAMSDGITIKLKKPIEAHGKTLEELTLREPVPEDLMQIGSPVLLIPSAEGDTGIEVRAKIIGAYISRLGGIPPSSVKAMSVADFMACQGELLPFLQGG
jgi:hypothetical protein